jgi:hypothetical protein
LNIRIALSTAEQAVSQSMRKPMAEKQKCYFCEKDDQLRLSHIIPKFVYNWAKDTAPSFLRSSKNPNRRIQDGEKLYLLCSDCEQLFGKWEKEFSENIFIPLHESGSDPVSFKYTDWCIKFSVSVSWRVLLYHKLHGLSHLSNDEILLADNAFTTWKEFLKGNLPHPGKYEQHILPLDIIESHNFPKLSPYINRYFLRGIDSDVIKSDTILMTYAKMCRVAIFGFIKYDEKNKWKGTKIHIKNGKIGATDYHITENIIRFLSERANTILESMQKISQKQADKIEESILGNLDKAASSDILKAMSSDVALFGEKAFGKK